MIKKNTWFFNSFYILPNQKKKKNQKKVRKEEKRKNPTAKASSCFIRRIAAKLYDLSSRKQIQRKICLLSVIKNIKKLTKSRNPRRKNHNRLICYLYCSCRTARRNKIWSQHQKKKKKNVVRATSNIRLETNMKQRNYLFFFPNNWNETKPVSFFS